jgi:hypothetical protein
METFPIVKRKDEQKYGEYRTKEHILEIYDAMQRAIDTGQPYQTLLDPPPANPRVAHPSRQAAASHRVKVSGGSASTAPNASSSKSTTPCSPPSVAASPTKRG